MAAVFALATSGCLSTIIPDHHASDGADAGTQPPAQGGNGTPGPGTGGNADADGGSGGDAGQAPASTTPNDPNCIAPAAAVIDGHHNAGQPCLQCHDGNTAGANKFTAAGTVYDKLSLAAGAQGLSGVTIEITDANGTKVSVVTASLGAAGNFWTDQPLVFPLQVRASRCPADRPMSEALAAAANVGAGGGNCSRAGCHDTNMIVHVP